MSELCTLDIRSTAIGMLPDQTVRSV